MVSCYPRLLQLRSLGAFFNYATSDVKIARECQRKGDSFGNGGGTVRTPLTPLCSSVFSVGDLESPWGTEALCHTWWSNMQDACISPNAMQNARSSGQFEDRMLHHAQSNDEGKIEAQQ